MPNGEQAQYISCNLIQSFPMPKEIASCITHYSPRNIFEWSEFSKPENFLHINFNSLTHLRLYTTLPVEMLLTRFQLCKLQSLSFLLVNNLYNKLVAKNQTHKPLNMLPPLPPHDPVFAQLRTLELLHVPHGTFSLSPFLFPCLEQINLNHYCHDAFFSCINCKHGNKEKYLECHAQFFQSMTKWHQLKIINYNSKKVIILKDGILQFCM